MIETHPTLAQQEFIAKEMLHRRNVRILRIMLLVLLLALWELCARLGIINDFIFSSPSRMTICFISMVKDGTIFLHTGVTVMETLVSFALVVVVGLATAILLWSSRSVSEVLEPYLVMLNSLPKSGIGPNPDRMAGQQHKDYYRGRYLCGRLWLYHDASHRLHADRSG